MPGQLIPPAPPESGGLSEEELAAASPIVALNERVETLENSTTELVGTVGIIKDKVLPTYQRVASVLDGWTAAEKNVVLPAHEVGDLLVMCAFRNDSGSITMPGWLALYNGPRVYIFYKFADEVAATQRVYAPWDYCSVTFQSFRGDGLEPSLLSNGALTGAQIYEDIFYFAANYSGTVPTPATGTSAVKAGAPSSAGVCLTRLTEDYKDDGLVAAKPMAGAYSQLTYGIRKVT